MVLRLASAPLRLDMSVGALDDDGHVSLAFISYIHGLALCPLPAMCRVRGRGVLVCVRAEQASFPNEQHNLYLLRKRKRNYN